VDYNDCDPCVMGTRADYIRAGLKTAGRTTKANDWEIIAAPCGVHLYIMTVPGAMVVRTGCKTSLLRRSACGAGVSNSAHRRGDPQQQKENSQLAQAAPIKTNSKRNLQLTDQQLLILALATVIPLSLLLYSNSGITDAKETLRAELRAVAAGMETRFNRIDNKLDEILRLVVDHDQRIARLEHR
jgi:hypothetical protein